MPNPWSARLASTSPRGKSPPPPTGHDGSTPPHLSPNHQGTRPQNVPSSSPLTPSRRTHTRSISHPFPSLFGSGKKKDQGVGRETLLDITDDHIMHNARLPRSTSPRKPSFHAHPPEEQISVRCMTCDHTNSFPRGRKGFRCGKCTAMNDLEPYQETLHVPFRNTEGHFGPQSGHHAPTLSLEGTQKIIDRCLSSYLRSFLDEAEQRAAPTTPFGRKRGVSDTHQPNKPYGAGRYDARTPSPSLLPGFKISQPPDSHSPASQASSAGYTRDPELSRQEMSLSDTDRPSPEGRYIRGSDSLVVPEHRRAASQSSQSPYDLENRLGMNRSASIFRPLENYIMASFNGCDIMNNSFLTVHPQPGRTASEGNQPSTNPSSEAPSTTVTSPPDFQLDAKLLLLSDIADNGSWWTGNRAYANRSSEDYPRDKVADTASGLTSSKTPRINWSELSEWYRYILHAGESWAQKWSDMKPDRTQGPDMSALADIWDATDVSILDREIAESRRHVQTTLLKATENLLQRPRRPLKRPEDIRFLLILLANPLLYASGLATRPRAASASRMERKSDHHGSEERPTAPYTPKRAPRHNRSASASMSSEPPDRRPLIIKRIIGLLANLPTDCHHILVSWFSRFSESHFRRIVELVGSFVTYRLTREQKRRRDNNHLKPGDDLDDYVPTFSSTGNTTPAQLHSALNRDNTAKSPNVDQSATAYSKDWQIRAAAKVMAMLFSANNVVHSRRRDATRANEDDSARNEVLGKRHIIPISTFYNTLLDYSDLIADFEAWESRHEKFSFCQYSFFLSIWAKIRILEHDARRQMESKAREAFFDSILGRRGVSQYLVLKVRRECLAEDSLRSVSEVVGTGQEEIKKGLRIEFLGEEGVDAGGLRKEWFLLLVREVFDPLYGLFVYDEDSQYCYFNPHCFESSEQFFLVGVLLGLAIYNSTILDIALPPFAFRKLLACAPPNNLPALSTPKQPFKCTLDDLAEFRPALARGLRQLLEYDGDVEETFCRDFAIQIERYGETLEIPLRPRGERRPVTNANRREFVDLYVKYVLDTAVSRQFEPFKRGFFTVCGGNAMHLFRPEEIELLVRGSDEPLDIPSLQAVAIYEHWHTDNPEREPVVNWFWDFFTRSSPQNQRKILSFITGSDRIPAMGATNLMIRLVCLGQDSDRFPTARTCFNMVALYRYRSRQKLEEKLWRAVVDSEGFGLK
ncbi:putative E3 ubiquitin-protein ligase [Onygenales sp. PD_40]|nr:putative E3 ubiquitin-protein ligase [Onygenales sp. PD_40]